MGSIEYHRLTATAGTFVLIINLKTALIIKASSYSRYIALDNSETHNRNRVCVCVCVLRERDEKHLKNKKKKKNSQ